MKIFLYFFKVKTTSHTFNESSIIYSNENWGPQSPLELWIYQHKICALSGIFLFLFEGYNYFLLNNMAHEDIRNSNRD